MSKFLGNELSSTGKGSFPASTTSAASVSIPHGTAPTTPNNGDIWTTSTSVYARVNGVTKDLAGGGTTLSISDTAPGSPAAGDLWWDSSVANLKVYYNDGNTSQWVDATSTIVGPTIYPAAGIAISTGSAWGTSLTAPTGTVVGTTDSQTLTNKTVNLSSNTLTGTIAQFNTAVSDADLATLTGTETLTNKTLTQPILTLAQSTVPLPTANGLIEWDSDNAIIAVGNGSETRFFYSSVTNDTLYQAKDSDLTAIAGLASTGIIARTGTGTAAVRTITGTTNKISVTNGDGVSGNPTLNIGSDVVTLTDTQTLTNKTLTAPVISSIVNTGTLTLPTSTDTLVGRGTTDTLTSKTIALGSNTVSGTLAQFNTAVTDADLASLAGSETLTNKTISGADNTLKPNEFMVIAVSDETTAITTGTAKVTFRAPFAMTLYQIPRASLSTASTSGLVTVDINEGGVSVLGTDKLSIDANEKTSTTAATATTLADSSIADDAEITIDIDGAGTGAKGLKVYLYYRRT